MAEYDRLAHSTQVGLQFVREELFRRDLEDQNVRLERMTQQIRLMTLAITLLTLISTVAVLLALRRG